ncbi:TonB-dependent receptor [Solitalea canadensis]|uniref:Outer membrane receptor protein n=1 Tax=Solitalea canadensis (strain ATCC 29591 / DSM 3403 / JCM 21819 / LMG 8368 / NBRC 15130 / NCIMB 12057 / USAM 9D) TaxID=929556 RepID=H8KTZ8_SOLCM|nr:TonB-dependent receptor [Solitalea canadensis]AFD06848.1 outer membrane receptor protein [Solitalea canadensis DSM 3403]
MRIRLKNIAVLVPLVSTLVVNAQTAKPEPAACDSVCHQLQEVTITAKNNIHNKYFKHYLASTTSSVDDIMARLPGITLIKRGNYALEPTVRGYSAGQINLTIDGMKIMGACTDKMDPATSYIETANLKQLQLQTSGESLQFGSNIGGSLNFKSQEPVIGGEKKLSGFIASGVQSSGTQNNNQLLLNWSEQKFGAKLNATYRKSENYKAGNNQTIPFSQYNKFNLNLAFNYLLADNSTLKTDFIYDDAWDIGYPALPMDVKSAKAIIGGVTYRKYFSNSLFESIEAKIYANAVHHEMDDTKRPDIAMHMDMPGKNNTLGSYIETSIVPFSSHQLTIKGDVYTTYSQAEMTMYANNLPMYMLTLPDNRRTAVGIFVKDDWQVDRTKLLTFNARAEYTQTSLISDLGLQQQQAIGLKPQKVMTDWLKSAGTQFNYRFLPKVSLLASLQYAERAPASIEYLGYYLFNRYDNYDYLGNPDIKTETALKSELKFQYNNDKLLLSLTGFYDRINHYITSTVLKDYSSMTAGANGVKMYTNSDYAIVSGAEATILWQPSTSFEFIASSKYTRGKDNTGMHLPLIPPLKLSSSVSYSLKKLKMELENEWAAAQKNVNPNFGETPTSSWYIMNLRLKYDLKLLKTDLGLTTGVDNLFDKTYAEHLDWGKIPRTGRNFYLSAILNF